MIANETRGTRYGIEMRIKVNGEYQWRMCEMERDRSFVSRARSDGYDIRPFVARPKLHAGELLLETLGGEAQIVMGLK